MELVDSDSEDEEFDDLVAALAVKLVRKDRNRIPLYCEEVVGRYFEFEFKRMFRLSRETFNDLADRYQAAPTNQCSEKCLVVLTYLGNQCNMYSIAGQRVLNLLHSLSAEVISWPDEREQERIKAGFLLKSAGKGPRNTIGCVDGSHVEINTPKESPQSYCNRKEGILRQRKQIHGRAYRIPRVRPVMLGYSVRDPFSKEATQKCSNGYILGTVPIRCFRGS
ncbi:hypothetical protein HPB48_008726 [Haemaphysalis longicornis]|uniref:Nuclease HARBI1 n=1 Tax=Haemaphysalis longicornis TaxID=44386 RepID=A0A9J6H6E4_HAELO|nr:hypothetical protein HPB48_008726 [Haemaphysalis longicornis]